MINVPELAIEKVILFIREYDFDSLMLM